MSMNESQHMRRMGVISGHLIFTCFCGSTGCRRDPQVFWVSQLKFKKLVKVFIFDILKIDDNDFFWVHFPYQFYQLLYVFKNKFQVGFSKKRKCDFLI